MRSRKNVSAAVSVPSVLMMRSLQVRTRIGLVTPGGLPLHGKARELHTDRQPRPDRTREGSRFLRLLADAHTRMMPPLRHSEAGNEAHPVFAYRVRFLLSANDARNRRSFAPGPHVERSSPMKT